MKISEYKFKIASGVCLILSVWITWQLFNSGFMMAINSRESSIVLQFIGFMTSILLVLGSIIFGYLDRKSKKNY